MKKVIALILVLASVFALCACGEPQVIEKEVEKVVEVVPEKYQELFNALEAEDYAGAYAIIKAMEPAPEYKEIVITMSNYSEYFEVISNMPDFEKDSFGNPSFFTIHGYVKLKDKYFEKLVPTKHSDVKFNVYYLGNAINVSADFANETYVIKKTGDKIEETTAVQLWNQTISGKEIFAGSFGMMGGSVWIGSEEIYSCNKISEVKIKGVTGTLYLYE